jgi:hypothetical protein
LEKEPRKATDVLLDLESKIETLLQVVRSQDLNIKLLSNKLNLVMEKIEKQPPAAPKIMVEAVNSLPTPTFSEVPEPAVEQKNIPVSSDFNIPTDNTPQGFRRTSRPETFSGDNVYLKSGGDSTTRFPMQLPKLPADRVANKPAEVVVTAQEINEKPAPEAKKASKQNEVTGSVPVVQRIVDKNGKSIFLAEVEVLDLSTTEPVFKTRTNGTGKWMASLPVGSYKVIIRKRESVSKEKLEAEQDIHIDGTQSPLELQTMIIR